MKKILLLILLSILCCSDKNEIFPDNSVSEIDQNFINQTINYSTTLPTSIKVNYSKDFEFSFRSFDNSVFDFDSIFDNNFQINVSQVYDSVLKNDSSIFVGKRPSDGNEFIISVYDTIRLSVNSISSNIPIENIKDISSNVISINGSDILTMISGNNELLDKSSIIYISLRQKYTYGNLDYIMTRVPYSKALLLNLNKLVSSPDTLFSFVINKDGMETKRSVITKDMYQDIILEEDSIRTIYSKQSNIFTDSIIAYDSIVASRIGIHKFVLENLAKSPIFIEDSSTFVVKWYFPSKKSFLYQTVIKTQDEEDDEGEWTLDSVYKEDSLKMAYDLKRPKEDFQDTLTLISKLDNLVRYEYLSKKTGKSFGIATKYVKKRGIIDTIFVGNRFIHRDTIDYKDTTNIFISHNNFEDYSGVLTLEDGYFYLFDVDEDGTISKK